MDRILAPSVCLLLSAAALSGCGPSDTSSTQSDIAAAFSDLLYVWAGDKDEGEGDTDFLAVIDADPDSPTYGGIISTEPVRVTGTDPHHAEPVAPRGALLFANGFDSGRTFLFDLSDPASPRLARELEPIDGFEYPHSFLRLYDGSLLATLQYGDGSRVGNAGGVARFDRRGNLLHVSSAADSEFEGVLLRPYAIEALPAADRVLTTGRTMNMATTTSYL